MHTFASSMLHQMSSTMRIHIAENPFHLVNSRLSISVSLSHFPSITRKNCNFLLFSRRKWLLDSTSVALRLSYFRASCVPSSTSYGGWEDLTIVGETDVPASVLVFAIGFTLGLFRTGTASGNKRRVKEEVLKLYTEKLKDLVEFFYGIDLEVNELKANLKNAIDNNEIRLGDLKNYIKVTDSISLSALNARNVVKNLIDTEGNSNVISNENHKGSKGKEVGEAGYELLQPIGGLHKENSVGSGAAKGEKSVKQDNFEDTFGHSGKFSSNLPKEYSHTVESYRTNNDLNAGGGSLGNFAFNNCNDERTDSPLENEISSL